MSKLIEIEVGDEQYERLRDGEVLTICSEIRKPLGDAEIPSSIDVIELQLKTRGLVGSVESIENLPDRFDDVEGVREKLVERDYIDG